MPSVTEFFSQLQRNAYHQSQKPRWAVIALGIFSLALGALTSIIRHGVYYGRFSFALGIIFLFFGVTEWVLRDSAWRWVTRLMVAGMWVTDFWLIFRG